MCSIDSLGSIVCKSRRRYDYACRQLHSSRCTSLSWAWIKAANWIFVFKDLIFIMTLACKALYAHREASRIRDWSLPFWKEMLSQCLLQLSLLQFCITILCTPRYCSKLLVCWHTRLNDTSIPDSDRKPMELYTSWSPEATQHCSGHASAACLSLFHTAYKQNAYLEDLQMERMHYRSSCDLQSLPLWVQQQRQSVQQPPQEFGVKRESQILSKLVVYNQRLFCSMIVMRHVMLQHFEHIGWVQMGESSESFLGPRTLSASLMLQ